MQFKIEPYKMNEIDKGKCVPKYKSSMKINRETQFRAGWVAKLVFEARLCGCNIQKFKYSICGCYYLEGNLSITKFR